MINIHTSLKNKKQKQQTRTESSILKYTCKLKYKKGVFSEPPQVMLGNPRDGPPKTFENVYSCTR